MDELKAERAREARYLSAGYVLAPDGRWIPSAVWAAHIRELRKRAERDPQWAP